MDPLVSVLLTVYKRTKFLPHALESALRQSFTDYEIIVTDDSGNSVAAGVCRPHSDAGLIRYQANRETIGVANSLRVAMDEARGSYIAILNDDDIWEHNFLASLLPPLQSHERRVLAFSDHWIISENGTINAAATDANTRRYGRHGLAEGELNNAAEFVLVNGSGLQKGCTEPGFAHARCGGSVRFMDLVLARRFGGAVLLRSQTADPLQSALGNGVGQTQS
jgi:glycosyltransferase involved in cell wall biosynthesis